MTDDNTEFDFQKALKGIQEGNPSPARSVSINRLDFIRGMNTGNHNDRQMNRIVLGRRTQVCGKDESILSIHGGMLFKPEMRFVIFDRLSMVMLN